MGVDHEVPVFIGHLEQQVVANDPGAGHEHVEAAELLDGGLHHRFHLRPIADIASDSETADGARHLSGGRLVEVRYRHLRTFCRKQPRGGGADSAAPAGDQRHPVLEPHSVSVSNAVPPSLRGSEAPWRKPSFSPTITWGRAKYES